MILLKFILAGVSLILGVSHLFVEAFDQPAPKLDNTWWGPGSEKAVTETVKPFRINFPQRDIDDLKRRLRNTRSLKPGLDGVEWNYGVNSAFIPVIVDHWLNKYNFTKRQEYLNQYPQFMTNIQGLDIHFLHVKPKNSGCKRVLPLLLQHGWPGSIVEFYKIIPLLTSPRHGYDFVFEVIVPSLPGYGFSSGTTKPGLGAAQVAVILKNLMLRLGFDKFYTQGGDWGAVTTANLASLFPEHVLGMHSNMCRVPDPEAFTTPAIYTFWPFMFSPNDPSVTSPLNTNSSLGIMENGYFHLQATKPDTLGVGLADSPAGLAAWILEKFSTLTNPEFRSRENGGLLDKFSVDELLDNLMLYWIPNSITTSVRLYAETFGPAGAALLMDNVPVNVPSACVHFPYEIYDSPISVVRNRFKKLIRATIMPRGGHFAAFEEPQLLANDVWTAIGIMESERKQIREEAMQLA